MSMYIPTGENAPYAITCNRCGEILAYGNAFTVKTGGHDCPDRRVLASASRELGVITGPLPPAGHIYTWGPAPLVRLTK